MPCGLDSATALVVATDAVTKPAIIVLAATVAARLLGAASAGTRYRIWMIALIAAGAAVGATVVRASVACVSLAPLDGAVLVPSFVANTGLGFGSFVAWAIGFAVIISGVLADALALRRAVARGRRMRAPEWRGEAERLARQLGIQYRVETVAGSTSDVPVCWGVASAVLLLPRGAEQWDSALRRSVLLHELAHLRRGDPGARLFERVIVALLWFSPAVWIIARAASRERELACDEVVLAHDVAAFDYAGHLLTIAKTSRRAWRAAHAFVRRSDLERRMMTLLDRQPAPRRPSMPFAVIGLWMLSFAIALSEPVLGASNDGRLTGVQTREPPGAGPHTFRAAER